MARRRTAPGDTTETAYHVRRSDDGPWEAADPADAPLARARRGRTWRARVRMGTQTGTTTLSRTGPTPSAARESLDLVIAETRRQILDPTPPPAPTLGDLMGWVLERIADGRDESIRSDNSRRLYLRTAIRFGGHPAPEDARPHKAFDSHVHGVPIDELTAADLMDEVERIAQVGGGRAALPHLRALWRKATRRGHAMRLITADPAAGLTLPSTTATRGQRVYKNGSVRTRDNALTSEQLTELRTAVRVRHPHQRLDVGDLIVLGTYTGLRIGEAVGLRWVDVHLGDDSASYLTVEGQVYGIGHAREWRPQLKTANSRRTVPLARPAADLLRARQATVLGHQVEGTDIEGEAEYVFPAQLGGPPDADVAKKAIRRTLDRAGFPWATFHTLRRTVEEQLRRASTDPMVIMRVMGHDPATSWSNYVDHGVDVMDAVDALG